MELSREELIDIVAFALWRNVDLRPRRRSLEESRLLARRIVEHLEVCGVRWRVRPPAPPHGTPADADPDGGG